MGKRLVLASCILLAGYGSSWPQTGNAARYDLLVVPGSPDDYWKAASLIGPAPVGPRFLLEFIRAVEAMEIHDASRLRAVYEYLGAAPQTRGQGLRSFTIPLPLRASVWSKLSSGGISDPFAAAIRYRRTRRVLYGAAALDPPTRAYLEGQPALVERIHRNHSDVFALLGRSFSVRDGRVDVPGGAAAVSLWEQVVGASIATPEAFLERLLARDTGELAALYDAVAHLDAPHQRFVLGLWMPEAVRRARFITLYRAARAAGRRVAIPHQPFVRTELDLFTVVSHLRVLDDGRPAPPASPAFWRPIFAQVERWQDIDWSGFPDESSIDATWFVEVVLLSVTPIWEQAATISFAQRLFSTADASPGSPPKTDLATFAVSQFQKFPALALALERMGVHDVAVYTAAFNRALALTARGNRYSQRQLLTQFQGAVAITAQLRLADRISVPVAEQLITSLARIESTRDGAYVGAVARWVAEQLLPALGADTTAAGELESWLLTALSGAPREDASVARLTWEDWEYRIDPSIVPLGGLRRIRALQAGNSLDAVLRLWQLAASLPSSRAAELSRGATDADALGRVKDVASSIGSLLDTIREPNRPTDETSDDAPAVKATLKELVTALAAVREPRHLSRVPDLAQRLLTVVDVLTGDVLLSLVYAMHIRDPDSPLWLQGDVAYRHDFGLLNRDGLDPALLSWWFPVEQLGTTWHVRGSLLGFDIALARLRLPRVTAGGPPAQPVMASEDQRVFLESVALFEPARSGDEAMHAIADAIRVGRERVTAAVRNQQELERLAFIGRLGEWRRYYILPWLAENRPDDIIRSFSLTELYWIGSSDRVSTHAGADAWGTSAFSAGGCLCLRIPSPQAWEDVSGRLGAVPTFVSDATFRLAELMSELKLPAVLARHLLPVLMRDFLDRVQMVYSDDWTAAAEYWATVQRARVEDAMAQLTVDGPLLAGATPSR
jgi:hypothetical protein